MYIDIITQLVIEKNGRLWHTQNAIENNPNVSSDGIEEIILVTIKIICTLLESRTTKILSSRHIRIQVNRCSLEDETLNCLRVSLEELQLREM